MTGSCPASPTAQPRTCCAPPSASPSSPCYPPLHLQAAPTDTPPVRRTLAGKVFCRVSFSTAATQRTACDARSPPLRHASPTRLLPLRGPLRAVPPLVWRMCRACCTRGLPLLQRGELPPRVRHINVDRPEGRDGQRPAGSQSDGLRGHQCAPRGRGCDPPPGGDSYGSHRSSLALRLLCAAALARRARRKPQLGGPFSGPGFLPFLLPPLASLPTQSPTSTHLGRSRHSLRRKKEASLTKYVRPNVTRGHPGTLRAGFLSGGAQPGIRLGSRVPGRAQPRRETRQLGA